MQTTLHSTAYYTVYCTRMYNWNLTIVINVLSAVYPESVALTCPCIGRDAATGNALLGGSDTDVI